MSDQSIMSRREALIAATAVASLAVVSDTEAATSGEDSYQVESDKMNVMPKNPTLALSVTLPDGKRVELKATQLVIDFGGTRKLFVNLGGVMPLPTIERQVNFREQPST
ncbi:MAG: hypothetical protein JWP89_4496 [Schlesneria sp.]|nr:hypothetical protein [Schlesneria sp.]